jgi:hypothetical protein
MVNFTFLSGDTRQALEDGYQAFLSLLDMFPKSEHDSLPIKEFESKLKNPYTEESVIELCSIMAGLHLYKWKWFLAHCATGKMSVHFDISELERHRAKVEIIKLYGN